MKISVVTSLLGKALFLTFLTFSPYLFISCNSSNIKGSPEVSGKQDEVIREAGPAKFANEIKEQDIVILDVRTPGEYQDGHIKNAVLIDFYSPEFEQEINRLDRNKTYYIYCHSGNRSSQAANLMMKKGFTGLVNLTGGITAWKRQKLPIEK